MNSDSGFSGEHNEASGESVADGFLNYVSAEGNITASGSGLSSGNE